MAQGKQIDAIKRVREQHQWNLQEARFYVQQVARMADTQGPSTRDLPAEVQSQVEQLIFQGQKPAAIKRVRASTHWSLKTAKDYVERLSK